MIQAHRFLDTTKAEEKALAEEISSRLVKAVVDNPRRAFSVPNPEPLRAAARRGDASFVLEYKAAYRSRFKSDFQSRDPLGMSA
jgi:hypothetical protein